VLLYSPAFDIVVAVCIGDDYPLPMCRVAPEMHPMTVESNSFDVHVIPSSMLLYTRG